MRSLGFVLTLSLALLASGSPVSAQAGPDPDHTFEMESGVVDVDETIALAVNYTITGGDQCAGISLGVTHDPALATVLSVTTGTDLDSMGSAGPDFFQEYTYSDGFAIGTVFSFLGSIVLSAGTHEICLATYQGDQLGETPLAFSDTLGSPMIQTVTVISGASVIPTQIDGELMVGSGQTFIRGDANADGSVDVSDAIQILLELFVPGSTPSTCADATDVTGNAASDISDAVSLLAYLFTPGSPPPAAPFPECGADDVLGCDEYTACP